MLPPADAAPCFHGGAFFEAVGPRFDDLGRRHAVVNADVLDAWFDPAPAVLDALRDHLPWLVRTSPPTHAEGLVATIARTWDVPPSSLVVGAGSSDLMFRAIPRWLPPGGTALLLDPTYGEYAHVAAHVCHARVVRHTLRRDEAYRLDLDRWLADVHRHRPDLAVLVHPNNPTGSRAARADLVAALEAVPAATRVWVDEAYAAYLGPGASVADVAARRPNVAVCTSLSKGWALSGMRAAFLVTSPAEAAVLRGLTPPWCVGLPAQVAAVAALGSPDYYAAHVAETHALRTDLVAALAATDPVLDVRAGAANAVLVHLPPDGPTAAAVVAACCDRGLFVRDIAAMGPSVGAHTVRVAVKDAATQGVMAARFREAWAAVRALAPNATEVPAA